MSKAIDALMTLAERNKTQDKQDLYKIIEDDLINFDNLLKNAMVLENRYYQAILTLPFKEAKMGEFVTSYKTYCSSIEALLIMCNTENVSKFSDTVTSHSYELSKAYGLELGGYPEDA